MQLRYITRTTLFAGALAAATILSGAEPAHSKEQTHAEAPLPEGAGVEAWVAYALANSPRVEAAFEKWKASVEKAPQARSLEDPKLTYSNFVARSTDRQGPMGRQRISITQAFPWFGTLDARGDRAERLARAAAYRVEAEANRVAARVRKQYAEYYYVERAREIFAKHHRLLEGLYEALEARYAANLVAQADLLRIESELEEVEEKMRSLEAERAPVRSELNNLLGRAGGAELPEPEGWEYEPLGEEELREFSANLYQHPELRARESEIRGAEQGIRLAEKQGKPDFTVGAEMLERRGESDEGMLMIGVSLPIWRENYAAARREARADKRRSSAGREAYALQLEAEFADAVFNMRDAGRDLRLFDTSLIPRAERTYATVRASYAEGEAGFPELVRAQREVLKLRYSRVRALANYSQSLAEIEEIAGRNHVTPEYFTNANENQ